MTNKPVTEAGQIALAGVKVYVAGPMTGLPEFNRPAFFAAEAHLKSLGAQVMNPAILPDGFSHDAYMRIAIPMLMECEAVAFPWLAAEQGGAAGVHQGPFLRVGFVPGERE